jgi:hypothetical protein
MTIRSVTRHPVRWAVPTSHNIQTRSVRHAVRNPWGLLELSAAPARSDPARWGSAAAIGAHHSTPRLRKSRIQP